MSTLITSNINNCLSFQTDTGIINYRTDGFFVRGCTNPTTVGIRYLLWDVNSTRYYKSATISPVQSPGSTDGFYANSVDGNYLINFNLFFSGPASCTLDYKGTFFAPGSGVKKMVVAESRTGYNNLRGSCIVRLETSSISPIRIYTSDTIIGSLAQYCTFSGFKIT